MNHLTLRQGSPLAFSSHHFIMFSAEINVLRKVSHRPNTFLSPSKPSCRVNKSLDYLERPQITNVIQIHVWLTPWTTNRSRLLSLGLTKYKSLTKYVLKIDVNVRHFGGLVVFSSLLGSL